MKRLSKVFWDKDPGEEEYPPLRTGLTDFWDKQLLLYLMQLSVLDPRLRAP